MPTCAADAVLPTFPALHGHNVSVEECSAAVLCAWARNLVQRDRVSREPVCGICGCRHLNRHGKWGATHEAPWTAAPSCERKTMAFGGGAGAPHLCPCLFDDLVQVCA